MIRRIDDYRGVLFASVKCVGIATLTVTLVATLSSCADGQSDAPAGDSGGTAADGGDTAAPAAEEAAPTPSTEPPGSLDVSVTFSGAVPERKALGSDVIQIDPEVCLGKAFDDSVRVGDGGALRDVVVRLLKVRGPRPKPDDLRIVNRDCGFHPRVSVAMKGTGMIVENEDPILHTTHPFIDGAHFFNASLASKGDAYPPSGRAKKIDRAGLMEIKCDVHPWMRGWVVVHDNPYIAKSDGAGRLTIDQIPPGTYEYVAWHESLGEKKGSVTIEPGKAVAVALKY